MAGQMKNTGTTLHEGEVEAQRRFGVEGFDWDEEKLQTMFKDVISPERAEFFESLPFFFIATANARGECDCSFRGREYDASGTPLPLLKVLDEKTLVFPDYPGNKLYNSLGNIIVNGHIGMLFIDFQAQRRMRLNGLATIIDDSSRYAHIWPNAAQYVQVTAQQVYGNCRQRIPRMTFTHAGSDRA
jgi:predicted pyridoxine 5'-phosphate oxidase superfamily flavin-nucleotide-binding protein